MIFEYLRILGTVRDAFFKINFCLSHLRFIGSVRFPPPLDFVSGLVSPVDAAIDNANKQSYLGAQRAICRYIKGASVIQLINH